jgi:hypothetical protein
MPKVKRCQHCRGGMGGRRPQALFCSVRCRTDAAIEKRRQRTRDDRKGLVNADGKWRLCCQGPRCDKEFFATRKDAAFCSNKCRQSSWRFAKMLGL